MIAQTFRCSCAGRGSHRALIPSWTMSNTKTSLFALVASLLVSVTRATTIALATRREDEDRSISRTDVGFTVVGIVCELYTCFELLKWTRYDCCGVTHGWDYSTYSFLCFFADIGFQVGKLFPGPAYNCDSWACRKVTHVCVMTLSPCIFSLVEVALVHSMVEELGSKVPVIAKIIQFSVGLVFVLYEAATQKPPGAGTTMLIVFAVLADILLIFLELCIFWKNSRKNSSSSVMTVKSPVNQPNVYFRPLLPLLTNFIMDTCCLCCLMSDEKALIKAADRGDIDKAMELLVVGTNIDCRDRDNSTPLHHAVTDDGESHLRVAELLLQNKASVDAVGIDNCTPLHMAAVVGNEAQAALLLRYKACVDALGPRNGTPLHMAAARGYPGTVDLLLRSNADINKQDERGWTALELAVVQGQVKVAELLRAAGAQEPTPALQACAPQWASTASQDV